MKNAIIFHGSGCNPSDYWYPYLKEKLEEDGFKVSIPTLTTNDNAPLNIWLPIALKENYDNNTVLIGHSSGAPLILSILEKLNINIKIKMAILVSGFIEVLPSNKDGKNPILQEKYDFEKIKANCEKFIFINSTNDPWGCDDKQGKLLEEKLGGKLFINEEGHMGSTSFNQPYKEFPFLVNLINS